MAVYEDGIRVDTIAVGSLLTVGDTDDQHVDVHDNIIRASAAPATSGATTKDPGDIIQLGHFWDGSISDDVEVRQRLDVSAASPAWNWSIRAGVYDLLLAHEDGRLRIGVDSTVILAESGGAVKVTLPTEDPAVAGQLWSDAGTVKVSAGA